LIGGRPLPGPAVPRPGPGGTVVLSVVVPALDAYPAAADVVVRYGAAQVRLPGALTVLAPAAVSSPGTPSGTSGTPQGVLPLGPLTADPAGP
jgi:hypothetical protein